MFYIRIDHVQWTSSIAYCAHFAHFYVYIYTRTHNFGNCARELHHDNRHELQYEQGVLNSILTADMTMALS